jgi:hypothetical protein
MFHTGTSIFHGSRNKYWYPIYIDDVAVDFPKLKILGPRSRLLDGHCVLSVAPPSQCLSDISGIPL